MDNEPTTLDELREVSDRIGFMPPPGKLKRADLAVYISLLSVVIYEAQLARDKYKWKLEHLKEQD